MIFCLKPDTKCTIWYAKKKRLGMPYHGLHCRIVKGTYTRYGPRNVLVRYRRLFIVVPMGNLMKGWI